MIFKNKKSQKFISSLLVIAILLPSLIVFSMPKKAEAFTFTDLPAFAQRIATNIQKAFSNVKDIFIASSTGGTFAIKVKEFAKALLREIAMVIARKALQEMTKSTVNWINAGFHGSPLFLENPSSFFEDITKSQIKAVVNKYGYDSVRYPFGKDFSINIIKSYNSSTEETTVHTLSKVIQDPATLYNYQNNFNTGGWNAFFINNLYPQNNYLGFQMLATEQLQDQIDAKAEKTETALDQGQGFLSPQTCPSNPKYNNGYNEFNRPSFNNAEWEKNNSYNLEQNAPACYSNPPNQELCEQQATAYDAIYEGKRSGTKALWSVDNTCPDGLVNTTPGAVVANQITTALTSQFRQGEINQAIGSAMSSILSALLNRLLDKGLNALASKSNPKPPGDNFTYNGLTLGSQPTTGGTNDIWDFGPDQPIALPDFKKTVENSLENTTKELMLMTNDTPNESGPGILQLFGQTWPKVQRLDICQPGPDFGWQDRMDKETTGVFEKLSIGENEAPASAIAIVKELQFAVSFFKNWINTQMLNALPSSSSNIDAVNDLKNLDQELEQLIPAINIKKQAVSRLQAIKTNLDAITDATPGSAEEETLVSLWKQYEAIKDIIANDVTLQNTKNNLAIAKDRSVNLDKLITQCATERTIKGWANPGGAASILEGKAEATEQSVFCDSPIVGGYSHGGFINAGDIADPKIPVTYPRIPLVNAQGIAIGDSTVNISMSCSVIFRASTLDYKGSLPGY